MSVIYVTLNQVTLVFSLTQVVKQVLFRQNYGKKMPTIGKESFYIKVFGKSESILQKCDIVALKDFARNNENFILELICKPFITSFVFQHQVRHAVKKYEHMRNLKIAHTSPHKVTNINVLIGLDHYHSLITGETIKGKIYETIAINLVMGWIICGNYWNENSNSNTLCIFLLKLKLLSVNLRQHIQTRKIMNIIKMCYLTNI